ncbi:hypothetical protein [uncultured Shewanella sp.]|uniref:hypothetical protein n=1 Tax=uncultured Shewanella sp. TaxID=173975 RepID=UPI002626585A|nr:hypothetical protein [uncultured Shewanella sp.]
MQYTSYRLPFFIMLLTLLSGCISTPQMAKYNSNINHKYPPISVFYAEPSHVLKEECLAFENESMFQYCRENQIGSDRYWQALKQMQLFEDVGFSDKDNAFYLTFSTVSLMSDNAADMVKAALSGASLMLLPMQHEHQVKAEVSLYFYDRKIKQYTYQLPYVTTMSLFNNVHEAKQNFTQALVSHLIADLQKDEVFSSKTIAAALQSTDYNQDLSVPKQVGDFSLAKQFSYYDPFLGHQSTYVHPDFSDDYIDLFVYPIRYAEIEDTQTILQVESHAIQQEISAIATKSEWRDLVFSTLKSVSYSKNGTRFHGVGFDIEYTNTLGEQKFSGLYLFQLEDKLIKWRTSFPAKLIEQAMLFQMWDIKAPKESLFMATFRQQWRKQAEDKQIKTQS